MVVVAKVMKHPLSELFSNRTGISDDRIDDNKLQVRFAKALKVITTTD
jgi:hypothetical protein